MRSLVVFLFTICMMLCVVLPASSQQSTRWALVIGNSQYPGALLSNPANDAFDMAQALRGLGFLVIYRQDLNRDSLTTALSTLASHANAATETLFYYSGHAFQVNGVNYLAPVDLDFGSLNQPDQQAVRLDRVFAATSGSNGPKILLLDACRDNPLANTSLRGLARAQGMPTNTFISFATAPNATASDGVGKHSPYTRALLKAMVRPGIPIEEMFKDIRRVVETFTEGRQIPWEESSLRTPFYFRGAILASAQITAADDDAMFLVNGEDVTSWGNDHGAIKQVALHAGSNPFLVRVFNQRSFTGGIQGLGGHLPEGWNYSLIVKTDKNQIIAAFSDAENQPADGGPRHGKWFTVVKGDIEVDEDTAVVHLADVDAHSWLH